MLEPDEVRRFGRELAHMVKRAAHDPEAFAAVWQLLDTAAKTMPDAADRLIGDGYSWGDLGRALGVSRQTAHSRYAGKTTGG